MFFKPQPGILAMDSNERRERTKQFAIRIVKLVASLPMDRVGDVLG